MTCTMEWRACVGFPAYEISEFGDMRRAAASRTRRAGWRLRGFIDQDGYLHYALRDEDGRRCHQCAHVLVAKTFIGPAPSPSHEVAHENGSRVANHYSNLRWATRLENAQDMIVHGTGLKGQRNGRARLTDADVLEIRREYRAIKATRGPNRRSVAELDQRFGVNRAHIIAIAKGKSWSHVPAEIV